MEKVSSVWGTFHSGFEIKWISLKEAIKLLDSDEPGDYEGGFIQIRDSSFLKEAEKFLN